MPRAPIFSSQQRKRPLGGVDTIAETPKTLVADKFMLESNECISLSVADPRRRFQPQVAATHFVRARLLLDPLPPAPSTDKRPRVVIANTADPRKRRQVIATQQTRLPGLLGANTPTINVSPVVGNWRGADQIEGNATVGYADFSVTGAHGTIVGTAGWKSYSQVLSQPVDLGEAINGTFTISGGDPTSLSGPVSPIIKIGRAHV